MNSTGNLEKFQRLLRELFQFDCADLDFGIYRIMNHKRSVIEKFITKDLPTAVDEELDRGALADQSQAASELKEVTDEIRETLGKEALDADGNLAETYRQTPLGKKYLNLKEKAAGGGGHETLEAIIFNHLYTFFSRYYQDGDFISKRRYSKREKYAIPYNGEEVYLYWANQDQYYIKTAEHFHDYTFSSRGVAVHFKLTGADVEQNNVKGDKRFFLPRVKEINWDEETDQLIIPFEYRRLTEQEAIKYGKSKQQEEVISEALEEIPKRLRKVDKALAAITAERHKTADGESISFLEHHLRQYTRRNTSDFFIHKDLKGFLSRELGFYLKNEVLNLDEMENAGEARAEAWFQIMRVVKAVGKRIIEFMGQVEDFQKMLWEKRKFITGTQYCITVSNIDERFYPDIAACEAQWDEWKELFHIDEEETNLFTSGKSKKAKRIAFLEAHPTLVLDTKHFAPDFVDRLLAGFDDLDGMTDGLLVHSENWQALNLLLEKYREQVKCIYIDPPYNTGQSEILYKNFYKDSSWLSAIENGLRAGKMLLSSGGIQCTTIDDVEFHRLREVLAQIFGEQNIAGVVVIKNNPSGRSTVKGFSIAHEYAIFCSRSSDFTLGTIPRTERQLSQYPEEDELGKFQWRSFLRAGGANDFRVARPRLHYPLVVVDDNKIRLPKMKWNDQAKQWELLQRLNSSEQIVWPVANNIEYTWRLGIESLKERLEDLRARKMRNGSLAIEIKFRLDEEGILPKTVWDEKEMNATAYGTTTLRHIMGELQMFSFPKSVYAVAKSLCVCSTSRDSVVLDYFAGSGTTAHAVINLNRQDGGKRRFILVEMADYFDTVLLPRIKKVTFTPEWKDGKPRRMATEEEAKRSPRIVKYIRLESYEDALNNIEFDDASGQKALKFDDYLLQYMLRWETRKSETLLNVEKLASPFSYKLYIHAEGQTREKVVDIPETFNYLLGLRVKTRQVLYDSGRRYLVYRGRIDHREIVIIWRETEGWTKADLEQDKKFVAKKKLTEGAKEIFVNGDSFIPNARALEPVFKARIFAGVEV